MTKKDWEAYIQNRTVEKRNLIFFEYKHLAEKASRRAMSKNNGTCEYEDMLQYANISLLSLIERFDPDRGLTFRMYANIYLFPLMLRFLEKDGLYSKYMAKNHSRMERGVPISERRKELRKNYFAIKYPLFVLPYSEVDKRASSHTEALRSSIIADLKYAVQSLPEVIQNIVMDKIIHEKTYKELSVIYNMTIPTIRVNLQRAFTVLRKDKKLRSYIEGE